VPPALNWAYKRIYDGVNYRLRTFAGGRFASRCRPTSIVILLTELCNAKCVHCDIWKNKGKEDSPGLDGWKTVLSDLRSWLGPVQVAFSGGEALLRPYTIELVAHGSAIGLFQEILTHGYWDDQTKIEKLALAKPWRVTVSLDGMSEAHTKIRGRDGFFEKTSTTIETLRRMRKQHGLGYTIRLKNVIMSHNLDDACEIARFGSQEGMDVFFQPIEQNYNTAEDPTWFDHSENWPKDTAKAVAVVEKLIQLKKDGAHIDNSYAQLESMIPYFRNPDAMRVSMQSHIAHERKVLCAALTTMQLQANGDLTICESQKPIGNVKTAPVRQLWENRPHYWSEGCCLERRCTAAEKESRPLVVLTQ
jgi:MoaA/NifB/PqqE/SkfB family radical SAM enzyme